VEPEARYTTVGATLLALVVAVVLAMAWLARTGARADFRYYAIYFERQSLEGLQIGGDVNMRGVKVGRVESYSISRQNINRVQVTVRIDRNSPVSTNTVAIVDRNILTGLARINLATPGQPGPELAEVPTGESYPVIPEGQSDIEQLTGAMNRLAITGASALTNMEQLLNKENREAFGATLANLRQVSGALSKRMGRLDEVADALAKSAVEFGKSSRDIAVAVERVSAGAQPAIKQADATLRDLARAVQALERETTALAKRLEQATDSGAHEIRATAQELRSSAEILSRAADRLQDPRAVIFGPSAAQLGPGERMR
jgi:phospholipid/cholesterol/gamma-HCH transport system substrate-binding protein